MSDAEFFSDLRHEVDLAARRYAEVFAERDRLMDDIVHIGFAVIPEGRTGEVHEDEILPLAKAMRAERDRLRAVVDAVSVMWDNVVHTNPEGTLMGFPLSDYDTLERALDALDVSPTGEDT